MLEELKKRGFKNEADEARWWDDNQEAITQEFEKAAAQGTLGHGSVARKGKTPTTTIRLDRDDISKARIQAESKGLKYQTYLKMLIREALRKEDLQHGSDIRPKEKTVEKNRIFVERRPQGGFAVRKPNAERASAVLPTQREAIEKARELNPGAHPLVERVRHTSSGKMNRWRKP